MDDSTSLMGYLRENRWGVRCRVEARWVEAGGAPVLEVWCHQGHSTLPEDCDARLSQLASQETRQWVRFALHGTKDRCKRAISREGPRPMDTRNHLHMLH